MRRKTLLVIVITCFLSAKAIIASGAFPASPSLNPQTGNNESSANSAESPYAPGAFWPVMRGDPGNSGRARFHKAKSGTGLKPVHFRTGNGVFSTPVIDAHGRIYVGSADHNFYAFDPYQGKELWRFETKEIIDSAACIGKDGATYFGSGDAKIHALTPEGKELWQFDVFNNRPRNLYTLSTNYWWEGNVVMGPDGALYAGNDDFFVYSITPEGKLRWAFRTDFLIWAAVAFGKDGTVYVSSFDMNIYALDSAGHLKWKTDLGNALTGSPAIGDDGTIYQGTLGGKLLALDGSRGKIKWSLQTGGHIYASAAVAGDGAVYITSTDGYLYAVEPARGSVKWAYYTGDAIRSSPSLGPDPENKCEYLVYFGGGDGVVYAIDPSGRRRWSDRSARARLRGGPRSCRP